MVYPIRRKFLEKHRLVDHVKRIISNQFCANSNPNLPDIEVKTCKTKKETERPLIRNEMEKKKKGERQKEYSRWE